MGAFESFESYMKRIEALKLQMTETASKSNHKVLQSAEDEVNKKAFESFESYMKRIEALKLQMAETASKSNHKVLQSNFRTIRNRIKTIHENEQKSKIAKDDGTN